MEGGMREGGEDFLPRCDILVLLVAQRGTDRLTGNIEKGDLRQGSGSLWVCSN